MTTIASCVRAFSTRSTKWYTAVSRSSTSPRRSSLSTPIPQLGRLLAQDVALLTLFGLRPMAHRFNRRTFIQRGMMAQVQDTWALVHIRDEAQDDPSPETLCDSA